MKIYQLDQVPEIKLAKRLFEEAICDLSVDGGDVRLFSAAMLRASAEFYAEVEGVARLEQASARVVKAMLIFEGRAGTC